MARQVGRQATRQVGRLMARQVARRMSLRMAFSPRLKSRHAAGGAMRWALLACVLLVAGCVDRLPAVPADDVAAARALLEESRIAVLADEGGNPARRVREMTRLGLWDDAEALLAGASADADLRAAQAELRLLQSRFSEAKSLVDGVLDEDPAHRDALLVRARLHVEAWELDRARALAEGLLEEDRRDEAAALLVGRIHLLEKAYDEALEWALRVQDWNGRNAAAHRLEADTRFWDQDPAGAEPALVRALELEPFEPTARFDYGYAIWRRVDATLLDDMAAQWNLALELHPLHYVTHWHWGNGHTNLTYADYAHESDSIVRERLKPADALIAENRIPEAAELTREIEAEFPESVLPAMMRGSGYFMAYDMERGERLDSAQAIFAGILERKRNYGPAHNGLATVIKERQSVFLAGFDTLATVIEQTPLPDDPHFDAVFHDVGYFPGDRVTRMVRSQLGPGIAFLPLIHRLGSSYVIPPLHKDLAEVMDQPSFRFNTTFDNRQWMDIRGVGSGAAGIEYVERGAHRERNVVAHEYAHQFHGRILSDREDRRIRELYFAAMEGGYTLDYYASNNESEYFAQGYEAYIMPVKVHPLNHKSMNTRDDLERKDPELYAFIDSLATRAAAYQAGEEAAFASNWAELYRSLSARARPRGGSGGGGNGGNAGERDFRQAELLLDSALIRDPDYVPAYLSYADLRADQERFAEAEEWLDRAEAADPSYAPVFSARSDLVAARQRAGALDPEAAFEQRAALDRRSLELEEDLILRARLNGALRELYASHARLPEAIEIAREYAAAAPMVSTYLRDQRVNALVFEHARRSELGYATASLEALADLVAQRPQSFSLRSSYADALAVAGRYDEGIATLEESQRILRAAGSARIDFMIQLAELHLEKGDAPAARVALTDILEGDRMPPRGDLRFIRVLATLGEVDDAGLHLAGRREADEPETPSEHAELAYTMGRVAEARGEADRAERHYLEALAHSPYHREARVRAIAMRVAAERWSGARELEADAGTLPLPLGPDFHAEVDALFAPEPAGE